MKHVRVDPRLQQNYDEYYTQDIAEWRAMGAIDKATQIRRLCAGRNFSTIIDIGAGEGSVIQLLADSGLGNRHFAVDISASGVEEIAKRKIPSLVECRQFDGYTLPYPDRNFDLAVITHVVEHVEHPRLLLAEAARVADYLFVEVPLEHNRRLPRDFVADSVGHINFYTSKTIRLLLQTCGLDVIEQTESHSSRRLYQYRLGPKGNLSYLVKDVALRAVPSLAQLLWTYHSSLLVRVPRQVEAGKRELERADSAAK